MKTKPMIKDKEIKAPKPPKEDSWDEDSWDGDYTPPFEDERGKIIGWLSELTKDINVPVDIVENIVELLTKQREEVVGELVEMIGGLKARIGTESYEDGFFDAIGEVEQILEKYLNE